MKTINVILKVIVGCFYSSLGYMLFNFSLAWKLALISFVLLLVGIGIRIKQRNKIYLKEMVKTNPLARCRQLRYPTRNMAEQVKND
ncbi:MAG: hypothetical protein WCG93_12820 [Paludibacter sp.]